MKSLWKVTSTTASTPIKLNSNINLIKRYAEIELNKQKRDVVITLKDREGITDISFEKRQTLYLPVKQTVSLFFKMDKVIYMFIILNFLLFLSFLNITLNFAYCLLLIDNKHTVL